MYGKIRILIIDQHPAVSRALRARLRAVPTLEVVGTATAIEQGLEQLRAWQPDVILLEVKGRSPAAFDPIAAISRTLSDRPVGIIILTSYLDEIERAMALQAGAHRYLLKTIDSGRLIAEIEAVARLVQQQFATGVDAPTGD